MLSEMVPMLNYIFYCYWHREIEWIFVYQTCFWQIVSNLLILIVSADFISIFTIMSLANNDSIKKFPVELFAPLLN